MKATRLRAAAVIALLAIAGACDRGSTGAATPSSTRSDPPSGSGVTTSAPAASPTPPVTPTTTLPTRGAPGPSCISGWVSPAADTSLFTDPLGVIRRTTTAKGRFVVVDIRTFEGPESPPADEKGYLQDIRRWYIKLYIEDDWTYQGRFVVEQRRFGRGVAAVAPYDTSGFSSPDWSGFQWDSAEPDPVPRSGLPGVWAGTRYDFVLGGEGLTIPGLPDDVRGCLDGS